MWTLLLVASACQSGCSGRYFASFYVVDQNVNTARMEDEIRALALEHHFEERETFHLPRSRMVSYILRFQKSPQEPERVTIWGKEVVSGYLTITLTVFVNGKSPHVSVVQYPGPWKATPLPLV